MYRCMELFETPVQALKTKTHKVNDSTHSTLDIVAHYVIHAKHNYLLENI